jgi:hypothetical protein
MGMDVSLPYMFRVNFCALKFSLPVIKTCYVICKISLFFAENFFDEIRNKKCTYYM